MTPGKGSGDGGPPTRQARVLIVEDYPDLLAVAVESLELLGYEVVVARNGKEALAWLKRGEAVDLLFTDLVMPGGINGLDLAQQARAVRPGIKILLTSGFRDRAGLIDSASVAAFPLLPKPYRFKDLAAKLRELLGARPQPKPKS